MLGIAIKVGRSAGRRTCPLCLDTLTLGLARCTLCGTRHHAACALELGAGGCATPGCCGRLQTPLTRCDHCREPLARGGLVHPRCGGLIHAACLARHVPDCIEAHAARLGRRGLLPLSTLAGRFGPTCPGCDELLPPGTVGPCAACRPPAVGRRRRRPRRAWPNRVWRYLASIV